MYNTLFTIGTILYSRSIFLPIVLSCLVLCLWSPSCLGFPLFSLSLLNSANVCPALIPLPCTALEEVPPDRKPGYRVSLFASFPSGIRVLLCLLSNIWKQFFHIVCPVFPRDRNSNLNAVFIFIFSQNLEFTMSLSLGFHCCCWHVCGQSTIFHSL